MACLVNFWEVGMKGMSEFTGSWALPHPAFCSCVRIGAVNAQLCVGLHPYLGVKPPSYPKVFPFINVLFICL